MTSPEPAKFFDKRLPGSTELLAIADAATLLGISATGMRRLQQGRHIPFFKVGRCVRFAKEDLLRYLAKRRVESVS